MKKKAPAKKKAVAKKAVTKKKKKKKKKAATPKTSKRTSTAAAPSGDSIRASAVAFAARYAPERERAWLAEQAAGADVLVTACPKCEVHLRCALSDPVLTGELDLEIMDLAALAASHLS